jgi:myo-inositol-1(or 4)-monophosphatase
MRAEYTPNFSEFASFAMAVARDAGKATLACLAQPVEAKHVEFKTGPSNPVTQADRDAEQLIVSAIRARYPAHGFLGEEGSRRAGDEFQWIVDPIDGTINFVHGLPWFAVSLALAHRDHLVTGVVYHPGGGELFVAERGAGAFQIEPDNRARALAVSQTARLDESLIGVGLPAHPGRERASPLLVQFSEHAREIRVMGSAALHLADVAAGRLEAFVEPDLSAWDIAAGVLLVREAGGLVTDFSGSPLSGMSRGDVAASNGRLHDTVLEVVRGRSRGPSP